MTKGKFKTGNIDVTNDDFSSLTNSKFSEAAEKWCKDNDWDYQKYGDRRDDRSAYDTLMNYEISGYLEQAFEAGAEHGFRVGKDELLVLIRRCLRLAREHRDFHVLGFEPFWEAVGGVEGLSKHPPDSSGRANKDLESFMEELPRKPLNNPDNT